MAIEITCGSCGKVFQVPDAAAGKKGKCTQCGAVLMIPEAGAAASPVTPIREPAAAIAEATLEVSTPLQGVIDSVLNGLRFLKGRPAVIQTYQRGLALLGAWGILVAGVLMFLHSLILASQKHTASPLLAGAAWLVVALILHYVAARFSLAGQAFIRAQTYRMTSTALLDCLGLLAVLGALFFIIYGIFTAVDQWDLKPIVGGLMGGFIFAHGVMLCLHPRECLNIECVSQGAGAGETALSIMVFMLRTMLALAPIYLGIAVTAGTVWIGWEVFSTINDEKASLAAGGIASLVVLFAALYPLIAYVLYALFMLTVDLYKAVFQIEREHEAVGWSFAGGGGVAD